MTRLPRTIRLDQSDLSVFAEAAPAGEWAVPGGFSFLSANPETLSRKQRAAFSSGFLGTPSFGWATLVTVAEASEADVADLIAALAAHFVTRHGAPSLAAAQDAARQEVAFARSLCDHPPGTILAVNRRFDGDELVEQFRTIIPDGSPCGPHAPIDLTALARLDG